MTEQELISLFDRFGYSVLKSDGNAYVHRQRIEKYSIFDRRLARRVAETDDLEGLRHYATDIFCFDMWSETLEKTINYFKEACSLSPVTVPAAPATGEETDQDPEQKQEETPAPPVIDQPKVLPVYDLVCKGCGKRFQANRRKAYCSPECYPSHKDKKTPETGVKAMPRPF